MVWNLGKGHFYFLPSNLVPPGFLENGKIRGNTLGKYSTDFMRDTIHSEAYSQHEGYSKQLSGQYVLARGQSRSGRTCKSLWIDEIMSTWESLLGTHRKSQRAFCKVRELTFKL